MPIWIQCLRRMLPPSESAYESFLQGKGPFAAHRAAPGVAELAHIEFEFGQSAAESVAVHSQLSGCLALVSFVLLQYVYQETLFEFAHGFRVENAAVVHLRHECLKLVLHFSPHFL